jgi:hypothetical protein
MTQFLWLLLGVSVTMTIGYFDLKFSDWLDREGK